MRRSRQIDALLSCSKKQLEWVGRRSERAARARSMPFEDRVLVKNLCENLRSVLDYLAFEVRERHGPPIGPREKIYFPITVSRAEFEGTMATRFGGVARTSETWRVLYQVQPFRRKRRSAQWLRHLNAINNGNKHFDLVEYQVREAPVGSEAQRRLGQAVILDAKSGNWVEFRFRGIRKSAVFLLHEAEIGVWMIAHGLKVALLD